MVQSTSAGSNALVSCLSPPASHLVAVCAGSPPVAGVEPLSLWGKLPSEHCLEQYNNFIVTAHKCQLVLWEGGIDHPHWSTCQNLMRSQSSGSVGPPCRGYFLNYQMMREQITHQSELCLIFTFNNNSAFAKHFDFQQFSISNEKLRVLNIMATGIFYSKDPPPLDDMTNHRS